MSYTPSGKNVTNFRMGSNRQYKTADGEIKKETIWLKVTVWGKGGEIVNQYCGTGSHVIVFGFLRAGEGGSPTVFQRKDGTYGASYEITASEIRILKGKVADTDESQAPVSAPVVDTEDDGDIPF